MCSKGFLPSASSSDRSSTSSSDGLNRLLAYLVPIYKAICTYCSLISYVQRPIVYTEPLL